jgi:hypothetical protein
MTYQYEESAAYNRFMANGSTDTYRAAGNADSVDSSMYHGYAGQQYFALEWGAELFWRVNWILTRDGAQHLQTSSSTIVREATPPIYPSDHSLPGRQRARGAITAGPT